MTVKQLKKALENYPDDMDVFLDGGKTEFNYGLLTAVRILKSFLPTEKEQIEQAYYDGGDNMCSNGELGDKQAQDYYQETYKNENL